MTTTSRRAIPAGCVLLAALSLPAAALGHGRPSQRVLSEARLLELETELLGAGHAREHALARRRTQRPSRPGRLSARARRAALKAVGPPSAVGAWRAPVSVPGVAIHTVVLPTGKVLYYPGRGTTYGTKPERAYVWDPRNPTAEPAFVPPPTTTPADPSDAWTIFCSGQSLLPDGRVLITGGQTETGTEKGARTVYTFNPLTLTWTRHRDMRGGRWYPTQALQPDGRTLIVSGTDADGNNGSPDGDLNRDVDVFDPADASDVYGGPEATRTPVGSAVTREYYPHMFLMPSGRTLVAGKTREDTFFLDLAVGARTSTVDDDGVPPYARAKRDYSTAVRVPGAPTQVMLVGGRDRAGRAKQFDRTKALADVDVFDETAPLRGWQPQPSLNVARAHHNTVLLPDGSMVTVGGGFGGGPRPAAKPIHAWDPATHSQVELYDPTTRQWRPGPPQTERRTYHSTAVLLPDGTVLSGGDDGPEQVAGDNPGVEERDSFEIYEPPYLHRGVARPRITAAPAEIGYGGGFTVGSLDPDVTGAVLMAPGAATHAVDMSQRHVALAPPVRRPDGAGYDLTAPAGPTLALPGYYMLFLLNAAGVPSEAAWVRLSSSPASTAGVLPTSPPPVAATPLLPAAGAPPATPTRGPVATRRAVVTVRFGTATLRVPRGRRTVVTIVVRRGATPVRRATVVVRWLGTRRSWTARTDRGGRVRYVLTGRRGGVLEARSGSARDRLRVRLARPRR